MRPRRQQPEQTPLDPREKGTFRVVYTIFAVAVVLSLILTLGGYAVWSYFF